MSLTPSDSRLVIVSGKGGSGKSTVAARIALELAAAGERTALCELAPARAIERIFDPTDAGRGSETAELAPELAGVRISSEQAMRDYVLMALKVRALRDLLFRARAFRYLAAATPGLAELVTVGKLWEMTRERRASGADRFDRVVLDAPASGHAVALLESPRTFAAVTAGGPLHAQALELRRLLADPASTAVVLVAAPEELAVNETLELERRLERDLGIVVAAIVANRVRPVPFPGVRVDALGASLDPETPASSARDALLAARERAETERAELARLAEGASAAVRALALAARPPEDREAVAALPEVAA